MTESNIEKLGSELLTANSKNTNRRGFLNTTIKVVSSLGTGNIPKAISSLKQIDNPTPEYSETLSQTAFFTAIEFFSLKILKNSGLEKVGNSSDKEIERMLNDSPVEIFIKGCVVAPIFEEMLFRGIPSEILKEAEGGDNKEIRWDVGIPLSIVFAGIHNFNKDGFDLKYLPLNQFLGGCFMWYLVRKRGLSHSILAHSSHNVIAFTEILLRSA
jgi:membrane protease YdiL (CAAX protease family)